MNHLVILVCFLLFRGLCLKAGKSKAQLRNLLFPRHDSEPRCHDSLVHCTLNHVAPRRCGVPSYAAVYTLSERLGNSALSRSRRYGRGSYGRPLSRAAVEAGGAHSQFATSADIIGPNHDTLIFPRDRHAGPNSGRCYSCARRATVDADRPGFRHPCCYYREDGPLFWVGGGTTARTTWRALTQQLGSVCPHAAAGRSGGHC